MASRSSEICSRCGNRLPLLNGSQGTNKCSVCYGSTQYFRSNYHQNPLVQAHDTLSNVANRIRNRLNAAIGGADSGPGSYYSPPPLMRPRPPLMANGRKRALLCAVSYIGRRYNIKGSVNDVRCMKYFLVEKMGFPVDSILVLTEFEGDPLRFPTKRNIQMAMRWLVEGCQPGDSLVFHYSGHGSRQVDNNDRDELDGFDETLCPVDFDKEGMILDDEINATIVRPLSHGTTLHAIIDACHSGTILDLPFLCRMNSREGYYMWEDQQLPSVYKGTSGGLAISISACDDNQTSADTNAFTGNTLTGALTYSFIQAVENEIASAGLVTYGRMLGAMRHIIREAKTGIRLKGPIASLLNKLLRTDLSQEPQLSSSEKFDIYSKQFVL
ncbi:hypothetical protein UlMin_033822 [Ulmus minor]